MRDFAGRITFMGGVDTQEFFVHSTEADVRTDVQRVRELLELCLIVSPSHGAILPNAPPANIQALAEATRQ